MRKKKFNNYIICKSVHDYENDNDNASDIDNHDKKVNDNADDASENDNDHDG